MRCLPRVSPGRGPVASLTLFTARCSVARYEEVSSTAPMAPFTKNPLAVACVLSLSLAPAAHAAAADDAGRGAHAAVAGPAKSMFGQFVRVTAPVADDDPTEHADNGSSSARDVLCGAAKVTSGATLRSSRPSVHIRPWT